MKQPARTAKIWKWVGIATLIGIPALGMAFAATVHGLAGSPILPHLANAITQLPTVSFWAGMLPSTKVLGGLPASFVIAFPCMLAMLAAIARMNHHRLMLTKENEAREMRDL